MCCTVIFEELDITYSNSLQAAAALQPGDTASASAAAAAAADTQAQDKQPAAAAARPLRASCPAGRAPPKEPLIQRRQSRRHSTGQGQGHSGAAPANVAAAPDAVEEEDMAAGQETASGQLMDRHENFVTPDQGAARLHTGKQGKANPHSPAVTAQGHQQHWKGSHKAERRQGRASLSSPAVGTGGPRQHRRASLGGGGVLPLAGHSFLLTAYDDDKQKKVVTQRITQLGGCVLEDIPKPQVLTRLTAHLMCTLLPRFAFSSHHMAFQLLMTWHVLRQHDFGVSRHALGTKCLGAGWERGFPNSYLHAWSLPIAFAAPPPSCRQQLAL